MKLYTDYISQLVRALRLVNLAGRILPYEVVFVAKLFRDLCVLKRAHD